MDHTVAAILAFCRLDSLAGQVDGSMTGFTFLRLFSWPYFRRFMRFGDVRALRIVRVSPDPEVHQETHNHHLFCLIKLPVVGLFFLFSQPPLIFF